MKSTDISNQPCPDCGYRVEAATDTAVHASPSPGDASLCFGCNQIHIFSEGLILRRPTKKEKLEISLHPAIIEAQIFRTAPGMPPLRDLLQTLTAVPVLAEPDNRNALQCSSDRGGEARESNIKTEQRFDSAADSRGGSHKL